MNQSTITATEKNTAIVSPEEEPIIIAIDHGYGNIKTSNFCFPANVTPLNAGLSFTDDILVYDGNSYAIGMGHKEFRADKIMDQDYYLLECVSKMPEAQFRRLRLHFCVAFP